MTKIPTGMTLVCAGCNGSPKECGYDLFTEEEQKAAEYVWENEGTLDRKTGSFLCDGCYIKYGQPASRDGWTATGDNLASLFGIDL